jgi:hypothetical protein
MTTELTLPPEVSELANQVSKTKQEEVQSVLSNIFKTAENQRRIVDEITISGIYDTGNIKLADTLRLNVKNARVAAEKVFDMKRSEVQNAMSEYKLEDKLWLRAKQTMQDLLKSVEETAKYKSETVKRYEIEEKQFRTQERVFEVAKYADLDALEFENMTEDSFDTLLIGLKTKHEAEKRAEQERLEAARIELARIEKQRLENEQLKLEAIEREKKAEKDRKIAQAKNDEILKAERAEKDKIAKELQDKKDAEIRVENQRREIEILAKKEADKLAKAPIKQQLSAWVETFELPHLQSDNQKAKEVKARFESFKTWAMLEIESI